MHLTSYIVTFILILHCASRRSSSLSWKFTSPGGQVDNIEVDDRDGTIYCSSQGDILKYSSQLVLSKRTTAGNQTNPQSSSKVLKFIRQSNLDLLLSCWQTQTYTLSCGLFASKSLGIATISWSYLRRNLTLKTGDYERIQVLPHVGGLNDLLMVSSRPSATGDQLERVLASPEASPQITPPYYGPALGHLKLLPNNRQLIIDSVLPYRPRLRGYDVLYDYVNLFQFEDHTYFVLNDIQRLANSAQASKFSPRLARVCNNDTALTSYTEISLVCRDRANLYAKAVHVDLLTATPIMYIVFEEKSDDSYQSHLCSYSLNLARDKIGQAVMYCHEHHSTRVALLDKLHDDAASRICQKSPTQDSCTSATNPYIDGTAEDFALRYDNYLDLEGLVGVNFLLTTTQEKKEVLFIGTESGLLTKLDWTDELYFTLDLQQHQAKYYSLEDSKLLTVSSERRDTTRYIYARGNITAANFLTGELHQLPIDSCQYYETCHACLTTHDPLKCVWCGGKCARQASCGASEQSSRGCSPIIYGFSPSFGPITGSTRLLITGDSFGNAKSSLSVSLGGQECVVDRDSSDNQHIVCLTKPVANATNASITVSVSDNLGTVPYDLRGTAKSRVAFEYREDASALEANEDGFHEGGGNIWMRWLLWTGIMVLAVITTAYLAHTERLLHRMKRKFAQRSDRKNDPNINAVTYSNSPDARDGKQTDSLVGLIKLNDSIMSSNYFCKTTEQLDQDRPLMSRLVDEEIMNTLAQEKILIDRNRLTLGHVLGSGQFGRVYKGFLIVEGASEHMTVAVKTLHNRCHWDDTTDNKAFLEEGLMMKDFDHENVLALTGVTFDANGLPMVITPFMLYGDLRSYISDESSTPTVKELIEFGIQVAQGMAYLANLKFVHRDLAARNCMLDENLIVKVADFGLSRDIYERDYYSSDNKAAKLPVKWMAIESLEKSLYSTKSDVWSYGVLLWELMTRGVVPYPDVDNFDLFSYLKEGRRMLRPRYCPASLYKIMLTCWSADPRERPTFEELVQSVSNVITQLQEARDDGEQQRVDRNETYCDVIR